MGKQITWEHKRPPVTEEVLSERRSFLGFGYQMILEECLLKIMGLDQFQSTIMPLMEMVETLDF